jgi:hypothetical protein
VAAVLVVEERPLVAVVGVPLVEVYLVEVLVVAKASQSREEISLLDIIRQIFMEV